MFSTLHKKNKLKTALFYKLYSSLQLGWLILKIMGFIVSDHEAAEIIFFTDLALSSFIPPVLLFLILNFYRIHAQWIRWAASGLFIIPSLTFFFALAPKYHFLFRKNSYLASVDILDRQTNEIGPWYIVNLAFLLFCWLLIGAVIVSRYRKLPKAYHSSVHLLACAWMVSVSGFIAEQLSLNGGNTIDFYLVSMVIGDMICYIAISGNGRMDYWNIWQRDVFDYLDEAIILVDQNGIVVEANEPANHLAKGVFTSLEGMNIKSMSAQPIANGLLEVRPVFGENGKIVGSDLYIMTGMHPMIYQFRRQPFPISYGNMGGEFFTITDVTKNRLTMERVREVAGIDPLTGINNRFNYEQTLKQMDVPKNFPLSVVSIDANNLKKVNDTFGHETGDRFLCQIAEILQKHKMEGSYIARIGGDEFIILLKRCSEAEAKEQVRRLVEAANGVRDLPYPLSFAVGYATKTSVKENIDAIIRRADKFMYKDKRKRVSI